MAKKQISLDKAKNELDQLAYLMDDCFRIPGINWRFGLEALIGLVPGAGDIISGMIGLFLLIRAFQFRLPKIVMARMLLNSFLDVTVGAIPLIGDLFDFAWKSNSRNMQLFHEYAGEPQKKTTRHWIFLASLIFGALLFFILLMLGILWLFERVFQQIS